jgi:hypothetical protein
MRMIRRNLSRRLTYGYFKIKRVDARTCGGSFVSEPFMYSIIIDSNLYKNNCLLVVMYLFSRLLKWRDENIDPAYR